MFDFKHSLRALSDVLELKAAQTKDLSLNRDFLELARKCRELEKEILTVNMRAGFYSEIGIKA